MCKLWFKMWFAPASADKTHHIPPAENVLHSFLKNFFQFPLKQGWMSREVGELCHWQQLWVFPWKIGKKYSWKIFFPSNLCFWKAWTFVRARRPSRHDKGTIVSCYFCKMTNQHSVNNIYAFASPKRHPDVITNTPLVQQIVKTKDENTFIQKHSRKTSLMIYEIFYSLKRFSQTISG